jgi:hypothetical protein
MMDPGPEAWGLLREAEEAPPRVRIEPRDEDEVAPGRGRQIVCNACGHPITSEDERIGMQGAHEHTCVNPHGLVFRIGCFAAAPGCRAMGVPTTDFTWFAGFAWCYALCGGCGTLLGWFYRGAGSSFFGLILDRIGSAETGRA